MKPAFFGLVRHVADSTVMCDTRSLVHAGLGLNQENDEPKRFLLCVRKVSFLFVLYLRVRQLSPTSKETQMNNIQITTSKEKLADKQRIIMCFKLIKGYSN